MGKRLVALLVELLAGSLELGCLLVELGLGGIDLRVGVGVGIAPACLIELVTLGVEVGLGLRELSVAIVELLLGISQRVVNMRCKLVIDGVNLLLVEAHLHQLLHRARNRNIGDAIDALELGSDLVFDIRGELVYVLGVIAHAQVDRGHHVGADLHVVGAARVIGQLRGDLVHRRGNLDERRVHVGAVLKLQEDHGVVVRAL